MKFRANGRFSAEPVIYGGLVICWLALCLVPIFSPDLIPFHDSLFKFQFFDFAYSHYFFEGELPHWLPYGTYGVSALYHQLILLAPSEYLVGLVGKVLKFTDTLQLFKIAISINVLIFTFGSYCLGKLLFREKITRFILFIVTSGSVFWLRQLCFTVDIIYLFPLSIYFTLKFWKSPKFSYLVFLGFLEVTTSIGSAPYFIPLRFFLLFLLSAGLIYYSEIRLANLKKITKSDLREFFDFKWSYLPIAFISLTWLFLVTQSLTEVAIISAGRDPNSHIVPLDNFLAVGRYPFLFNIAGVLGILQALMSVRDSGDNSYYFGLLPPLFWLIGMWKSKRHFFMVFALLTSVLWILSLGGNGAKLIYEFPGMNLYRHIGLLFAFIGYFSLLSALIFFEELNGYGVSEIPKPLPRILVYVLIGIFLIDCYPGFDLESVKVYFLSYRPTANLPLQPFLGLTISRIVFFIAASILFFIVRKNPRLRKIALYVVVTSIVFDLFTFQYMNYKDDLRMEEARSEATTQVSKLAYQNIRQAPNGWKTSNPKRFTMMPILYNWEGLSGSYMFYNLSYSYLDFDPCYPNLRTDLWNQNVPASIEALGGTVQLKNLNFYSLNDISIQKKFGCDSSKIIFPNALALNNHYEVLHFSANQMNLSVKNTLKDSTPLAYLDAFDSRWEALLDGQPAQITLFNKAFKSVEIPPGEHLLDFIYCGKWMRLGLWLYALSACMCLPLLLWLLIPEIQNDTRKL